MLRPPILGPAPAEYERSFFDKVLSEMRAYFARANSPYPHNVSTLNTNRDTLPTDADTAALRDGDVFRDSTALNVLKSWPATLGGVTPGGSNTQVQFNDSGAFGGDADFTWAKTTNTLTLGSVATSATLITPAGAAGTAGAALSVATGAGNGTGGGGALSVGAGNGGTTGAGGDGGSVTVDAGVGGGTDGWGGDVQLNGGNGAGTGQGGVVQLISGDGGATGAGGGVTIASGAGVTSGAVAIYAGQASGDAGTVTITGGLSTGAKGGGVFLRGGTGSTNNGSVQVGPGSALATTATGGFFCVPNCAGTPTGTPADIQTGSSAMLYDTSANKIWIYNGSWKSVALT